MRLHIILRNGRVINKLIWLVVAKKISTILTTTNTAVTKEHWLETLRVVFNTMDNLQQQKKTDAKLNKENGKTFFPTFFTSSFYGEK